MTTFEGRALACHRGGRMVFAELAFALDDGAALVLRGSNGAGKSSLLRLLALLTPRRAGALYWQGQDIDRDRDSHRARLRFVGHSDAIKPALTAAENLLFAARLAEPTLDAARVDQALQRLGLGRLGAQPARFLSAGQRRRLALARLAASPGRLWLLDEPGTGLDTASLERLHALVADHRAGGGIVVASTHGDFDPPQAQTLDLDAFAAKAAA